MNARPYRTLFVGTLVQESFLSIGGTEDHLTTVDSAFCRDGAGRPTMRGTGVAGALVATLRRMRGTVPGEISGAHSGHTPSVWRTFHSHPESPAESAFRQHVAIDFATGAAAEGALYDLETLPPGTRWPFLLEVNTHRYPKGADFAETALSEWQAGRCWLGREVARGLGWMRLEELQVYELSTAHLDLWPCSFLKAERADYIQDAQQYIRAEFQPRTAVVPFDEQIKPLRPTLDLCGRLIVGEREDGYGLDSLSVGGHATDEAATCWDKRFLATDGQADPGAGFDPEMTLVGLTDSDSGCQLPYVPGSSLRGSLRHALSRLVSHRCGDKRLVDTLFGTTERSARLLIRDLLPVRDAPFRWAWLQQHAEDEFTAGAFESAKFDRMALFCGEFSWRMALEADSEEELRRLCEGGLRPLFDLAEDSQIGIGGGQWRGHGWPRWIIDTPLPSWEKS